MSSEAPTRIDPAPHDLCGWTRWFLVAPVPVLADTAEMIEVLRANEDAVDARVLGETVAADPLMTLKLLAHVSRIRNERSSADPETVTAALVLLGIAPFFKAFGPQTSIEDHLAGQTLAQQGLHEVLTRSRRAASFALAFAVHRVDPDAQVIYTAALLHDFAEVLLWLHAPELAQAVARRQRGDAALRSAAVQRELLHVELRDLQMALMRAWHLPELLVHISDERHARVPAVRNVSLAVRLARHTARGWDNPALADDVHDIAQMLNLAEEPTLHLLRDIDS